MIPRLDGLSSDVTLCIIDHVPNPARLRRANKKMRDCVDQWLTKLNVKCNFQLLSNTIALNRTPPKITREIAGELKTLLKDSSEDSFSWLTSLYPAKYEELAARVREKQNLYSAMRVANLINAQLVRWGPPPNEKDYLVIWDKLKLSGRLNSITRFEINDDKITCMPSLITDLSNLQDLAINKRQLHKSTDGLLILPSVKNLVLSNQDLQIISQICTFPNLQFLRMTSCSFPATSAWLSFGLKELHVSNNTTVLTVDALPPALEVLQLSHCGLTEFPEVIAAHTNLKSLVLDHNQIPSIPASIGNCQALTYLNVSDNQLKWLPAEVFQLSQLISLNLNRNQIVRLPENVKGLELLEDIGLENNQLGKFPRCLLEVNTLESVEISGNQINAWPKKLLRRLESGRLTVDGRKKQKAHIP